MSEGRAGMDAPPFPPGYRASGVLLHVTSLPSAYGVGDLGPSAFAWVDRLHEAGQGWWQGLPVGPTGYGDSPYQALSSFAGSGLLISPDGLIDDELLRPGDCRGPTFSAEAVEYEKVVPFKLGLLRTAWSRFRDGARADLRPAYEEFCRDHAGWLDEYALYRALKAQYGGAHFVEWPADLVRRVPDALAHARREVGEQIELIRLSQFLLFRQAERLRRYARGKGVRLIGDLPFFVSLDSSDVWASPELFLLDERQRPRVVAGVPPDYFSADGQRWGNPIYDWDALRGQGFRWCIERFRALLAHVDAIRLDHFRAFAAAWHVPAESPTARVGRWVPGPGADLFRAVREVFGRLPFIAEDLGVITPDVVKLRDEFDIAGTRVLQFAFDGGDDNSFRPHNYVPNTVVYTGTHDNPTTRSWYEELPAPQRQALWSYLQRAPGDGAEVASELMRLAWTSVAALAIVPLQDVLNLGSEARMNVPGRADGNWRWRCSEAMLSWPAWEGLRVLTKTSSRLPAGDRPMAREPDASRAERKS